MDFQSEPTPAFFSRARTPTACTHYTFAEFIFRVMLVFAQVASQFLKLFRQNRIHRIAGEAQRWLGQWSHRRTRAAGKECRRPRKVSACRLQSLNQTEFCQCVLPTTADEFPANPKSRRLPRLP